MLTDCKVCVICGHPFAACSHDIEAVAAFEALLGENRGLKQEIEEWKMTTAKLRVMFNDTKTDRKRFTRLKDAVSALIPHIHDDGMCGETDFEKRVMELEKRWKIVLGLEKDDPEPIPSDSATVTALRQQLETARADVTAAAGEMLLDVPKPGTDAAKMFIVNRMLQRERDALKQELDALKVAYDVRGETAEAYLNDLDALQGDKASAPSPWHPTTVLPPEDSGNCGYSIKVQVLDSGDIWSPCRLHLVTGRWYGPHGELLGPEQWREVEGG